MLNEFTMVVALEVGPRQFAALDGLELAIEQTEPFDQGAYMGDRGLCRSRSDRNWRAPDDCEACAAVIRLTCALFRSLATVISRNRFALAGVGPSVQRSRSQSVRDRE